MSHSLQPLRHLNFDLSPYPFKALARRHFRFLAWCTALTVALWVPLNPIAAQTRALTAITLATTVAGQPVTTVTSGTVVTLTGTVTAGTTTLTAGQVNFCVASAKYCADINILGSAQLTSAGTAVMKFRPGRGSHSYKAVFLGTNIYSGSSSGASALTVTGTVGPFATATSIAETGAWGDYTLTGTVTEAGGTVAPTGSVSFLDASNANSVLAIGSLGAAVAGVGWPNPKSLANTQGTYFVLVADLNADGIPDLVLGSNQVSIYLGNANGTYTKGATISVQQAPTRYPIVTADFNEDGIPDLAVPLYGLNDVAILLGKGDGTFEAPIMASVPGSNFIKQIVVGDFNGDGIPDLALIDSDTSTLGILLANGDGTFTQDATKPPVSGAPTYIATGDFNGDGKTDVAVAENDGTIAILLGNGDGTFAALGSVNSGSSSSSIAVADLNGDGRADIVLASGGGTTESIIVLTGNGDGTFNSSFSVQSPTSTNVTWVHVADFNQDGTPDVVLADSIGGATVFLNNGGGSLDKSFPVVSGLTVPYYFEVGVGDLNGDGYPDIVAGGYYNNSQGLYLTEPTETASASASIQVSGVGQHLVQASFPAEGSYESSLSSSIPLWGLLPATSTTLSVTSGGATVTSVTPATAVLLSAHVSVGTTPVTSGQVNFCDASAPHCTDIHILGSAALSSSGTATFKFVPGSGTHSYQAQFVEDGFGLASASNIASLTVGPAPNPVYSDITAISGVDGFPGDYSLTATVVGYGGPASPTGAVSFVDTSFGNNVLATASLGTGIPGTGFLESLSPSFGSYPTSESTADFNGDGIPDLAIVSTNTYAGGSYTLAVFLGKGDGTFRAGPTIQPSGMQVDPFMIFGDFNGDGKLDLAMLTWGLDSTSYLTILLNNGDSSFTAKPTVVAVSQSNRGGDGIPGTMAAADFNGDGKLDLAVVGDYISAGGVGILLGNGDGTFSTARILVPDQDFGRVAVGDFNGDGIPDLVVTHYFEFGTPPTIFLGKGDGAFTAKLASFTLDYFPTSIVVGDFNGDGIVDLAFSDLNGVEIALGNGDGTFNETSASPIQVPDELYSLQAGDFNHDGKLDLAGWDTYFGQIVLLLGAGDGTFAPEKATPGVSPSTFGIHQMAAADFNGDGVPDLALLTYSVNTASILLTVPTETSTATVDQIAPIGPGTHNVEASYSGNSTYRSGVSDTVPLFAGLAPIVFTPAAGTYTTPLTITLSESIPGSTIYYSASGIVSTNGFVPYTSPIPLTESGVATILAYATETGYLQSHYAPETFTINLPTVLISNLSPAIKAASSSAFALTVNGLGFTSSSTVNWGSTALSTQYVSATELTAQVPASAIANAGTATLIVQTPGVGSSNAFMFEIDSAGSNTPPNFTTSLATVSRASSANYAVTLPSSASNVSATCLNLPTGATCSYSASTGAITIKTASSTPAGTYQIIVVFTETLPGVASASLFLPILLLPRLFLRRKWAAKRLCLTACLGLLVSAIAIGSGCGGGGNAPPPQTHQVTTSGVVTLTVQ
jgi:FG-GAP-like repeat/Bacterial Ig-like domain (group 3)/FG-GAP repeat